MSTRVESLCLNCNAIQFSDFIQLLVLTLLNLFIFLITLSKSTIANN